MTSTHSRRFSSPLHRLLPFVVLVATASTVAHGQAPTPPSPAPSTSENLQPRSIGDAGTTLLGVGGHVDRAFTIERETAFNYTVNVDVGHFLTRHLVVQGGVAGSGSIGGGDADDPPSGTGVPALHAFGGALWYFTPRSLASLYSGAEYWSQLTQRDGPDAGAVLAKVGLQGALSSRASVFVEGGYGIGLTRNEEGSPTRMVGRFGVRFKL